MSDLGYHQQIQGGIFGRPNPATDSDPVSRAALQAKFAAMATVAASAPGAVPPSYEHLGGGNVARVGWTAQKPAQSVFPPYTAADTGRIPDWEDDANSTAGGRYDQNQAWGDGRGFDPSNRAPVGGTGLDPNRFARPFRPHN